MPRRGGRRRRDEAVERSRRCRAVQAQIKRRRKLLHALNRALRHRGGAEALHSSDRYKGWKDTYLFSKFGSGPLHIHVKRNAISTRVCGASLVHVNCENTDFRFSWKEARLRLRARPSSRPIALRRSSCSTCVGAIAARAQRTAFVHGIDRVCPGAFPPWCPAGTPASPEGAHCTSPFVSLMTVVFRMRASPPTSPPPSSPPRALHCHALLLSCSQDDRDAHQLCSREGQRPQRRSLLGRLFPGWDQDCLRIARRDDQSLGFRCVASSKSSLLGQN